MGRRAGEFFEEAREVEGREVRDARQFFERQLAFEVRVHQLDGAADAPVNEPHARKLHVRRPLNVRVPTQDLHERLLDERVEQHFASGRVVLRKFFGHVAGDAREAPVVGDDAFAE
jgi:hypothetical protein